MRKPFYLKLFLLAFFIGVLSLTAYCFYYSNSSVCTADGQCREKVEPAGGGQLFWESLSIYHMSSILP
jgi:hypothetical protein